MSDERFDHVADLSKWKLDPSTDKCEVVPHATGIEWSGEITGHWEPQSNDEFFCIFCRTKFTCGPERVIATANVDGVDWPACLPCAVGRGLA